MRIMATNFGYKREAVRVKAIVSYQVIHILLFYPYFTLKLWTNVQKIDGNCMPETRKFSVDPQITSYEVLRSILTKAFDIKP